MMQSSNIVKSIIGARLGKLSNKIYARNCTIKTINVKTAKAFLDSNHLKGYNKCSVRYGLFHNDVLVSVMTFSKSNISRKSHEWEIDRFCSIINTSIIGGASKLFKAFIRDCKPTSIISYADSRWGTGKLYSQLGFEKISDTVPNYWYFMPNELKRYHRYSLRKNSNDDQSLTEYENRLKEGWFRIWDCGSSKWRWSKK